MRFLPWFPRLVLIATAVAFCGSAQAVEAVHPTQPPAISLTDTSFHFGRNLPGIPVVRKVTTLTNRSAQNLALTLSIAPANGFTLASAGDRPCGVKLDAGSRCDVAVQFLATAGEAREDKATLTISQTGGVVDGVVTLAAQTVPMVPGVVTPTANPQVALYTFTVPMPGEWYVDFGPTAAYGRTTATLKVDHAGETTGMYVAGMLPNAVCHMRAKFVHGGNIAADNDHTFTAGALPPGIPAALPVTIGATGTPQPGIELLDPINTGTVPVATDLQGNVIWTYPAADSTFGTEIYPVRLLPNGNFLAFLAPNSYPPGAPGLNLLREFDLAGNTIRQLGMDDLNAALAAKNFPVSLLYFTHDVVQLPNQHLLLIANTVVPYTDLPGHPPVTNVVGDVVVDLDPDWKPVWVWNEFDHLDINRQPMQFPDWTHSNSVAYSADDRNFIISIRHQNWVVKVDYRDGKGSGNILWKLGEQGDFTLIGGVDPTDWFYAQHDVEFMSARTAGKFTLGIMDNGDDRMFAPGVVCNGVGNVPCLYSTIQRLDIDEKKMTATLTFHQILPTYLFSGWGGNTEDLANGDIEYGLSGTQIGSQIFEVTNETNPQMVWNLSAPQWGVYRGFRIPSLYPGVQW